MWMLKLVVLFTGLSWVQAQEVVVEIPQGSLKGLTAKTAYQNKPYFSFKGIPYAKPNVGSRKFDAPQPAEPWTGVWDATKHGNECVYFCMIQQKIQGDEDCQYLNVYTPSLLKDDKKAVMVLFHAGGFGAGSGNDDLFGPDFLVEQDVIFVTLNSRLGPHGYLSTEDENAPGNLGLKDQVVALKWVQANIEHFGGDKDKVTIVGPSSGAACVQYHMMSPMSQGLFSRAIAESGSALNPWAFSYKPRELAFKLGEALGFQATSTQELMSKLKEIDVKEMIPAAGEISKTMNHMNGRMNPFVPSVEPNAGQEMFLSNDPWEMMKSGKVADVPLLIGILQDEAASMANMFLDNTDLMNKHFHLFLPDYLNITDDAKVKEMSDMIRNFYFDGKQVSADSKPELWKLMSDVFFNIGSLMSTKIIGANKKSPTYEYFFSYYTPFGLMKNLFKSDEGIAHGDEWGYLFYSNAFKNMPVADGVPSAKMVQVMTKMWANFAKDQNPTSKLDDDVTVNWEPFGNDDNYLNIKEPAKLEMEKGLFKERVNFWAKMHGSVLGDYEKLFN